MPTIKNRTTENVGSGFEGRHSLEAVHMGITKLRVAVLGTVAAALTFVGGIASAQESTNQVAAKTDWSVFEEPSPKECWAVSTFKESLNTRNGAVVAVNRSQTLLMVFFRPDQKVNGQVTFTGGYPFKSGSTVGLKIDDKSYDLFTEGEWAWPQPEDDAKIVAAMKRGKSAVLTGQSGRGTKTQDTFSLLGFTAAVDDASKRCS